MLIAPRLILTRPQADSEGMAAQLTQQGIASLICPMLAIIYNPNVNAHLALLTAARRKLECVLLTSRHSVAALPAPKAFASLPIFAVGEATARAAAAQGWLGSTNVAPSFEDLLPHLRAHPYTGGAALYLRGNDITATPELHLPQWKWHSIITYSAQQQHKLTPDVAHAIGGDLPLWIALFSVRSAQAFEAALPAAPRAPLHALCLSQKVASTLEHSTCWHSKCVADNPTQAAMLTLIRQQLTAQQ